MGSATLEIPWRRYGRVQRVVGNLIEVSLPEARMGSLVTIHQNKGMRDLLTEVVSIHEQGAFLLPYDEIGGLKVGSFITQGDSGNYIALPPSPLGQVFDPFMHNLLANRKLDFSPTTYIPLDREPLNPMVRQRICQPLSLGIRSIDGLLTFGQGQRIAIMAGSGVGKSVLMGMIARGSAADVNIIGLIGERGREVREFIERDLGKEGLKRSVVIVATSDTSPLMRIRAAKALAAIAEYFSSTGRQVLVMLDSLSRVATAQREIGLAIGEPPTTKGYPPSLYTLLPRLLERCGPQKSGHGAISGIFTVLVDGDDFNDPIPDTVRSIVDGHFHLSRDLASLGYYPAIDIATSVSRVMKDIVKDEHFKLSQKFKAVLALYEENKDFIQMGTYQPGNDSELDYAVELMPRIKNYLQQDMKIVTSLDKSIEELQRIFRS